MNKLFIVTMYNWGDKDSHSYILGIYDNYDKAYISACSERSNRGWIKYVPEILSFDINVSKKYNVELALSDAYSLDQEI